MKNKIIIIIFLIVCFIAGILFDKMVLNKKNDENIENNSKIEKNDNKSDEISAYIFLLLSMYSFKLISLSIIISAPILDFLKYSTAFIISYTNFSLSCFVMGI